MEQVKVIGAGLAGSEAAWQLAQRGLQVTLYEMKPNKKSPAHHADTFAELVCSNSLRGDKLGNATRVEAGGCLAVVREGFSALVTEKLRSHPNVTVVEEELTEVPQGPVIVATGPLTSDAMSEATENTLGKATCTFSMQRLHWSLRSLLI